MKYSSSIFNFIRLHQLEEFPEPKYEFWFLYWIGGIVYEDGNLLSDFYFINKTTSDDNFKEQMDGPKVSIQLDVTYYTYFSIGCIFCLKGYLKTRAPYNDKNHQNTISLSVINFSKPSKHTLDLGKVVDFPISYAIQNCTYYIIEYKIDGQYLKVLIPELVLCSYLFFRNSFVTKSILNNTLNDCFDLSNFERVILKNGMSAIRILYDNRIMLPQEAHSISQFFNIKNGTNAINSISSNLMKGLSDTAENFIQPYISANLQFMEEIEMEATGRFFVNEEGKKTFVIFEILGLQFKCEREKYENNILLEPMFKEEYNYSKIVSTRLYQNFRMSNYNMSRLKDIYRPHRPVIYSGINVYVNQYKALKYDSNKQLNNFYSYHVKNLYRNEIRRMLSREMLNGFQSCGLKALIMAYKSDNDIITKLNVANSEYSLIIYELEFSKKNVYYVELSDEALLTIHNYLKIKISMIDIVLILESIIFNFSLEANQYKPFTLFDKEKYKSKFNVYINFHYSLQSSRRYLTKRNILDYINEIKNIVEKVIAS